MAVVVQTVWQAEGATNGTTANPQMSHSTSGTVEILMASTSGAIYANGSPVQPQQSSSSLVQKSHKYLVEHFTDNQPLVVLPNGTQTILAGDPYKVSALPPHTQIQ